MKLKASNENETRALLSRPIYTSVFPYRLISALRLSLMNVYKLNLSLKSYMSPRGQTSLVGNKSNAELTDDLSEAGVSHRWDTAWTWFVWSDVIKKKKNSHSHVNRLQTWIGSLKKQRPELTEPRRKVKRWRTNGACVLFELRLPDTSEHLWPQRCVIGPAQV